MVIIIIIDGGTISVFVMEVIITKNRRVSLVMERCLFSCCLEGTR